VLHDRLLAEGACSPDPVPGDGEQLFDISSSGVNVAETHHRLS
jgi:hypothetical protein